LPEDEIYFSVLWKLGLGAIWVLIKWSKDRVRVEDLMEGS
jgi:hypothetical protein